MEAPPPGYVQPFLVYLVEFTDDSGDVCTGQAGALTSEEEAKALVAQLEADGFGPLRINMVPVHERAADWQFDR